MFFFDISNYLIGKLKKALLLLPEEERRSIIEKLFFNKKEIKAYKISFIDDIWREWNPIEIKPLDCHILNQEEAEELKAKVLKFLTRYRDDVNFIRTQGLYKILCIWERWSNAEEIRAWTEKRLKEDKDIVDFLYHCVPRKYHYVDSSAYSEIIVNSKVLKKFCNLSNFMERSKEVLQNSGKEWLTEEKKLFLEEFVKKGKENFDLEQI